LQQAKFVALKGLSGSGKSTLLNIIGLLERPTSDLLNIAGQPAQSLGDAGPTKLRGATICFVFQFPYLLAVTPSCSVARLSPMGMILA